MTTAKNREAELLARIAALETQVTAATRELQVRVNKGADLKFGIASIGRFDGRKTDKYPDGFFKTGIAFKTRSEVESAIEQLTKVLEVL